MSSPFTTAGPLPTHLSASQLTGWTDCGERYRLERIEHIPQKPAWWNAGGTAVHRTFQDITEIGLNDDDAAKTFVTYFSEEVDKLRQIEDDITLWRTAGRATKANPNKENFEWWIPNGMQMCRTFAIQYNTPFLPGKVVPGMVEVAFDIQLGDNRVKGFIDAIVEMPDGSFVARDYKAGSRTPASALQLAVYSEAMYQLHGVRPATGQFLMTRKMILIDRDVSTYTPQVLTRLFDNLAKARKYDIYVPNVGIGCGQCSVKESCSFGPDKVDS